MKITLRTTYTINGGDEKTCDLALDAPAGRDPAQMDVIELMTLAANSLVARGQVMVCGAVLRWPAEIA